MKCQYCSSPATVHVTKIIKGGARQELHLCEPCANKHASAGAGLSLSSIVQSFIGQHVSPVTEELSRLICPTCGIKYMEFRADGRLGCPSDYEVFRIGMVPILQRIHRATRHVGKTPRRTLPNQSAAAELLDLRQQLRRAIDREDYELAIHLRDTIREKEAMDESR